MKWKGVKAKRIQPTAGEYSDWKPQIADDCWQQCVYCAIHESCYGGLDNFHVEHYRPKSLSRFKKLVNIITNLFLACPVCNRFKSNDWPNDPIADHSIASYPDPSAHDYNNLFQFKRGFEVVGANVAARYVVERLYLNRPQLILERRTSAFAGNLDQHENFFKAAVDALQKHNGDEEAFRLLSELAVLMNDLNSIYRKSKEVRPYHLEDVRRPGR